MYKKKKRFIVIDLQLRSTIAAERNRVIQKMESEKNSGTLAAPFRASRVVMLSCHDDDADDGQQNHIQ